MIKVDRKTIAGLGVFCAVVAGILYLLFPLGLAEYFTNRRLLAHFFAACATKPGRTANKNINRIIVRMMRFISFSLPHAESTGSSADVAWRFSFAPGRELLTR